MNKSQLVRTPFAYGYQMIFAVLDVWDYHVVLTLSFKLLSFLHLF